MSNSDNAPSDPSPRTSLSNELEMALGPDDAAAPATAFLVGLAGKNAGKLYRIPDGTSLLGRSSRAFLTLDEKGVSHQHAQLTLTSTGCTVSDLQSTNGTRVNDVRLSKPQELHAGDVLRLGNATLGFLTDAEDEQQHTRALARMTGPQMPVGRTAPSPLQAAGGHQAPAHIVPAPAEAAPVIQAELAPTGMEAASSPTEKLDDILDKLDLVFRFLGKYVWLLVFSSLLVATLAATTVAIAPPPAIASFQVFLREEQVRGVGVGFASQTVGFFEFAEKNFTNPDLVRETLEDVKKPTSPGVVRGTARSLALSPSGARNLFDGTFRNPDAEFAEKFLAQHLKNFLEYEIGEAIRVKSDEVRLLRRKYEENQARLVQTEEDLRDFKKKHLDALPDQAAQQLGSKIQLLSQRDALAGALARYRGELDLARKQMASGTALIGAKVEKSSPYEQALSETKKKIAAAKARGLAEGHPEMQQLRKEEREYTALKQQALGSDTTESERQSNLEYKALANRIAGLEVSVASTSKELGMVHGRLNEVAEIAGDMPAVEAKVSEKMRNVSVSRRLHDKLFDQLKAKEIELELERANVSARYEIMRNPSAAKASPVAAASKRAVMGGVGGLVVGLVLSVLHWLVTYARGRGVKATPPQQTALVPHNAGQSNAGKESQGD